MLQLFPVSPATGCRNPALPSILVPVLRYFFLQVIKRQAPANGCMKLGSSVALSANSWPALAQARQTVVSGHRQLGPIEPPTEGYHNKENDGHC